MEVYRFKDEDFVGMENDLGDIGLGLGYDFKASHYAQGSISNIQLVKGSAKVTLQDGSTRTYTDTAGEWLLDKSFPYDKQVPIRPDETAYLAMSAVPGIAITDAIKTSNATVTYNASFLHTR